MYKKYSEFINEKLGYNISRLGNKEEDYKSRLKYQERKMEKLAEFANNEKERANAFEKQLRENGIEPNWKRKEAS